uniref:DM2 domain-containing protein n=1 Tax=Ananas comosus var. bracteatus TaxID=296719 RepID=A0A6V7Q4K4_ANACO|nr:unnamed protein product [Ananas comosus var. bracteatus]
MRPQETLVPSLAFEALLPSSLFELDRSSTHGDCDILRRVRLRRSAAARRGGGGGGGGAHAPGTRSFARRRAREGRRIVGGEGDAAEAAPEAGKRRPRGITKPRPISPELQELVGVKEIPRTQALKLIWAYIKENNLQDPENKRIVVCDEKLKKIFGGKDRVGFLEISGLLNPHFMK